MANTYTKATNVEYTPDGTGATARPVKDALADVVTVKSFGAAGDGSTDDGAAFRNAKAATSGTVRAPGATYVVGQDASNAWCVRVGSGEPLTLTGDGQGRTTLRLPDGVGGSVRLVATASGAQWIVIRGMTIDGNKAGQTSPASQRHGIFLSGATNVVIEDCHVKDCEGDGIYLHSGTSNVKIRRNKITGCARNGVTLGGAGGSKVWIEKNEIDIAAQPIDSEPTSGSWTDVWIEHNYITAADGTDYAITAAGLNGTTRNARWHVNENHIYNAGIETIFLDDSEVRGNYIDTSNAGATKPAIHGRYTLNRVAYRNNILRGNQSSGLVYVETVSGEYATDLDIVGNTLTVTGTGVGIGVRGADSLRLVDNTVNGGGSSAAGISLRCIRSMTGGKVRGNTIKASTIGVQLQPDANLFTGYSVTDNRVAGTPTHGIRFIAASAGAGYANLVVNNNDCALTVATGLLFAIAGTYGARAVFSGEGTPEGVVSAPIGSQFLRRDGGAGTTLYVKESGTGNTGWAGK